MKLEYKVVLYGVLCRCTFPTCGLELSDFLVKYFKKGGSDAKTIITKKGDE